MNWIGGCICFVNCTSLRRINSGKSADCWFAKWLKYSSVALIFRLFKWSDDKETASPEEAVKVDEATREEAIQEAPEEAIQEDPKETTQEDRSEATMENKDATMDNKDARKEKKATMNTKDATMRNKEAQMAAKQSELEKTLLWWQSTFNEWIK